MWPVHALVPCMHVVEEYTWNLHTAHQEGMVKTVKVGNNFIANSRGRFQGFGRGGGFQVTFKGKTFGNAIILYNCKFFNNEAFWGGGFKASFQDNLKTIL